MRHQMTFPLFSPGWHYGLVRLKISLHFLPIIAEILYILYSFASNCSNLDMARRHSAPLDSVLYQEQLNFYRDTVRPVGVHPQEVERPRWKFILCFDGTGNKFSGTDSDSNILKIYRMLDRNEDDQLHYYQPGIGTYVVVPNSTKSSFHTSRRARFKSWYMKAKDSAVGKCPDGW